MTTVGSDGWGRAAGALWLLALLALGVDVSLSGGGAAGGPQIGDSVRILNGPGVGQDAVISDSRDGDTVGTFKYLLIGMGNHFYFPADFKPTPIHPKCQATYTCWPGTKLKADLTASCVTMVCVDADCCDGTSINSVQRWIKSVADVHVQRGERTPVKLETSFAMPNNLEDQVTIEVEEEFIIGEISVKLENVRHERAGDLRVTLVSPDRVSAVLMAAVGHCPLGDGVVSSNPQELYTGETLHDQSTEPTHGADYTFSTSAAAVFPDCEDLVKRMAHAVKTGLPLPAGFDAQAWHAAHVIPGGTYRNGDGKGSLGIYEGHKNPAKGKWRLVFKDDSGADVGYFSDACVRFIDKEGLNRGPYCMKTRAAIVSTTFRPPPKINADGDAIPCAGKPPCITGTVPQRYRSQNGGSSEKDPAEDQISYPWRTFFFKPTLATGEYDLFYQVFVNGRTPEGSAQTKLFVTDIGCTDPTAFNYMKAATYPVHTADASFCNYSATTCVVNDAANHVPLRIPVSSPHSRTATYTIDHSAGAMIAARLRDQWLQSDCDGKFGTYNDPIGAPCVHRFYRDTWQLTVRKLDEHHTQVAVTRVDNTRSTGFYAHSGNEADTGWAYDGLQIEYTTCGQSGKSGGRQGLWRPTEASLQRDSSKSVLPNENCSFVRTRDCDPDGPIEEGLAIRCGGVVREGWSGFCSCADRKTYKKGCENHPPFTCKDACAVPDDWICDPTWYDNGMCDVACGSSDPDCSRDALVPWARLEEPMYNGQGNRRHRDVRGWS